MPLDKDILLWLNSLATKDSFAGLFDIFCDNALVRGGPIFFILFFLYFSRTDIKDKDNILFGVVVSFIAVYISVRLQFWITPHVRPFFDPTLGIKQDPASGNLNRLGSFPSDTASMYAALCMTIFLTNRLAGVLSAIWAFFTIGICRVALGYHYPSDILAGVILGGGLVLLMSRGGYLQAGFSYGVRLLKIPAFVMQALLFLCLADAYNQFVGALGVIHVGHSIFDFLLGHPHFAVPDRA